MSRKGKPDQHTLLLTPFLPRTRPLSASRPQSCTGSILFLSTLAGLIAGCSLGACCGYFLGHENAKIAIARAPIYSAPPGEAAISIVEPLDAQVYHEAVNDPGLASSVMPPAYEMHMQFAALDPRTAQHNSMQVSGVNDPNHNTAVRKPSVPELDLFTVPAAGSNRYRGKYYSQSGQDDLIDELMNGAEGGFFVESGAYNGVDMSNTLFLEATRGWTGLLVEANPFLYAEIVTRSNRTGAAAINACVSPTQYPGTLPFRVAGPLGGLTQHLSAAHQQRIDYEIQQQQLWVTRDADGQQGMAGTSMSVECWPLHSILQAIGQKRVDYWSLDTEGSEADILRATDFNTIDVRIITVEVNDEAAERAVLHAMADKPYQLLIRLGSDLVFVKQGAFDPEQLNQISAYNPSYAVGTGYQPAPHRLAGQASRGSNPHRTAAAVQPINIMGGMELEEDLQPEWFGPDIMEELWPGTIEDRWTSGSTFHG